VAAVACNNKISFRIYLVICLTAIVVTGSGQGTLNLQKTVVLPANVLRLDSLLHLINRQAGIKFSINTRKIPASRPIRLKNQQQTIAGILQEIKKATGVYYAVLGDHIILLDNPPKRPVPKNKNPQGNKTVVKKNTLKSPAAHQQQLLPPKHTAKSKPSFTAPAPPPVSTDTLKTQPAPVQQQDTAATRPPVGARRGGASVVGERAGLQDVFPRPLPAPRR